MVEKEVPESPRNKEGQGKRGEGMSLPGPLTAHLVAWWQGCAGWLGASSCIAPLTVEVAETIGHPTGLTSVG